MNISLISTVFNEAETIQDFLQSISAMSRLPGEFIIVDAGSTDGTAQMLLTYAEKAEFPVKVLVEEGCNIARGRNIAIANASYDLIAVTDAGCKVDRFWLEEIVKPFDDATVDVVAGWYEPDATTYFECSVALCTFPQRPKGERNHFLPSSRSIAFRKDAWSAVGGYPEWLTLTAEDTFFDLELKANGKRFHFNVKALVKWKPRSTFRGFLRQQYLYGYGDGEAGLFQSTYLKMVLKLSLVAGSALAAATGGNSVFFLLFLTMLCVYAARFYRIDIKHLWFGLVLSILGNFLQIVGWIKGRVEARSNVTRQHA